MALRVVAGAGGMVFPALGYHDSVARGERLIAGPRRVAASSVELAHVSGRGNPDLLVTCRPKGGPERRFLVVLSLMRKVSPQEADAVAGSGLDAVLVDLKGVYDRRRREDKHFDRVALPLEFQSEGFLSEILTRGNGECMRWLANAKRDAAERESRREHEERLAAEERRRREAEQRRHEQERERRREMERIREENARQRAERLEAAARAAAAAARAHEADLAAERERIRGLLDQQDERVVDSLGNRWVRCERCGREATTDDFQSYGGRGRINLGVCKECARGT